MKFSLILSGFLLSFFFGFGQNLFVNGDFNGNTSTHSTCYPNWLCVSTDCVPSGGSHQFHTFSGIGQCNFADAVDCSGSFAWVSAFSSTPEYMMQNVSFTPGTTYTIEFFYTNAGLYNETCTGIATSAFGSINYNNDGGINVKVDGTIIATSPSVSPSPVPGGNVWHYFSTNFTASSISHWIRFDGAMTSSNGPSPYIGMGIDKAGIRLPNDEGSTFGAAYDGIDNDGDGLTDCLDPDAAAFCGINNPCNVPMPEGLLDFNAVSIDSNTVALIWHLSSSSKNARYDVMRSRNGQNWEPITSILADGKTEQYSYLDQKAFSGDSYYRLKEISKNGEISYSNSVHVRNIKPAGHSAPKIYPNPAKDNLVIEFPELSEKSGKVRIFSISGKMVFQQDLLAFRYRHSIKLPELKGIYFVQIFRNGSLNTEKLMIE